MRTVDFYFDYISPFAYLASLEAPELVSRRGAQLHWRPVLFAGLLGHWGQLGPAEIPPKATHAFRACVRHARAHGVPFRSTRFHPFNPLTALRATLSVETDLDRARAVQALYAHGWAEGGDLGDAKEIEQALSRAGLDGPALVERAATEGVKKLLRDQTNDAIRRGVFGVPTLVVEGESFWGLDQLLYLALFLEGKDPLLDVDLGPRTPGRRGAAPSVIG